MSRKANEELKKTKKLRKGGKKSEEPKKLILIDFLIQDKMLFNSLMILLQ